MPILSKDEQLHEVLGYGPELRAQILKGFGPSEMDEVLEENLENRLNFLAYKHQ